MRGARRYLPVVANALAVLDAANALRPFDRRHRASLACFGFGLLASELPLEALTFHLAANGAFAARGGLRGREGQVAAGLGAVAAAGFAAARLSARTAAPAFERALVDALGGDYRRRVRQPAYPGAEATSPRAPGAFRMLRIRRRFAHDADLGYGPHGRANLLDIWSREDLPRDGRAPVLLQIPGGAWISGNKQGQAYPLMSHLAERGWVCVAINYRLGPRHRWPAQIVDVKRAIAWTRRCIAEHGGDPGFIAVTGGSAGGHLASLAALTPGDPQWQPGFEEADTSVAAAVPFYGVYDFVDEQRVGHPGLAPLLHKYVFDVRRREHPEVYRDASPLHRIHPGAPPFLVVHGVNDSLVPVEQGRLFADRLREVSRSPVAYAELPGAQHAFDIFASPRAAAAARATAAFLGVVYGHYAR